MLHQTTQTRWVLSPSHPPRPRVSLPGAVASRFCLHAAAACDCTVPPNPPLQTCVVCLCHARALFPPSHDLHHAPPTYFSTLCSSILRSSLSCTPFHPATMNRRTKRTRARDTSPTTPPLHWQQLQYPASHYQPHYQQQRLTPPLSLDSVIANITSTPPNPAYSFSAGYTSPLSYQQQQETFFHDPLFADSRGSCGVKADVWIGAQQSSPPSPAT